MAGNISGIQPGFQYNPYMYGDYDYLDLNYTPYMGTMGMDTSVFGSMPFIGCGPMMGMGSNQSYFDNMRNYQQFYNNYNIDQQRLQRNADLRINGAMEAIKEAAENLKDKVERNEQDQIQIAYQSYIDAVKSAFGEGSDEEIKSRALSLYSQLNGESLVQQLRKNSHSSFIQGFLQPFTLGTYYQNSAEDNISQITGQPVATGEKTEQNVGRVVGSLAVGSVAGGITYLISSAKQAANNAAKSSKGIKSFVVAMGASLVAGILSTITGKVSS